MNKTILMGRLTAAPELRYLPNSNTATCKFTLAVNRKYVKNETDIKADFFNIVAWNKTAEFCSKYLDKGQQILVTGRLQNEQYEKDGVKRQITKVIVDEVEFAESKKTDRSDADDSDIPNFPQSDDDDLPF